MWRVVGDFFHSAPPRDLKWNSPSVKDYHYNKVCKNTKFKTNLMDMFFFFFHEGVVQFSCCYNV